jgi:hypothetical protein
MLQHTVALLAGSLSFKLTTSYSLKSVAIDCIRGPCRWC